MEVQDRAFRNCRNRRLREEPIVPFNKKNSGRYIKITCYVRTWTSKGYQILQPNTVKKKPNIPPRRLPRRCPTDFNLMS